LIIIRKAGSSGIWKLAENFLSKGRNLRDWNHAVRVDDAGVGILDRNRSAGCGLEHAIALVERRKGQERERAGGAADAFIICEEERLVAKDAPTIRAAELVLLKHRFSIGGLEVADRVQFRIAQVIPDRAVKIIGAA